MPLKNFSATSPQTQPDLTQQPDQGTFTGWPLIFAFFLVLHGILLVTPRVYPFIDLPFHLTAATAMAQVDAGAGPLSDLFTYDLAFRPNVVHLLFVKLPVFASVEWGNRVYYGIYALLLPLSVLFLVRRLRGDPAVALLAFLLLYNFDLHWGFAGYTLSIPLVLFFLGGLVSEAQQGSRRRRWWLSLLLVAIFLTHALAALFASLLVLLLAAEGWRRERRLGWWWVPLPMWGLLVGWWLTGRGLHASATDFDAWTYYRYEMLSQAGLWYRLKSVLTENLHLWPKGWRFPLTSFFTLAVIAPLLLGWRRLRPEVARPAGRYALLFLLAALGCVALLPPMLPGQWAVFQRFPVFLLLAAIGLGSRLIRRWTAAGRCALVLVLSLHAALYIDYFLDFARSTRSFRPDLFAAVPVDARLAAVIYDTDFRDQPLYAHFGDYFTIWRGGESASSMAHFRFGVVRYRTGLPKPPEPPLWIRPTVGYDGRFSDLDYLLVRGSVPAADRHYFSAFDLAEERSPWLLYRRRMPHAGTAGTSSVPPVVADERRRSASPSSSPVS